MSNYGTMQADLARKAEDEKYRLHLAAVASVMAQLSAEDMAALVVEWRAELPSLRTKDPNPITDVSFREWVLEHQQVKR